MTGLLFPFIQTQKMTIAVRRWAFFFIFLFLLSGCSRTKIAYNFSDWFLLKRVNHYFNLTSEQESVLKKNIESLLYWHRKHELPKIIEYLTQLKILLNNNLTFEDINWIKDRHRGFWKRFARKAAPDFSIFLPTVKEEQIQHLKIRFAEKNNTLVKQTGMNDQELLEETLNWYLGTLEKWLGRFEPAQKDKIKSLVRVDPDWVRVKLENRRFFQSALVDLLRSKKTENEIHGQIIHWIDTPENLWLPDFKIHLKKKQHEWNKIIVNTLSIINPEQKLILRKKIQHYIDDFQDLVDAGT